MEYKLKLYRYFYPLKGETIIFRQYYILPFCPFEGLNLLFNGYVVKLKNIEYDTNSLMFNIGEYFYQNKKINYDHFLEISDNELGYEEIDEAYLLEENDEEQLNHLDNL